MQTHKLVIMRIDVVGGAVVLLGLATAVWFGLLNSDSATAELQSLRRGQSDMQARHSRLQKFVDRNTAAWQELHDGAQSEGKLSAQLPIEDRLRAVRAGVEEFGWGDLQIKPLAEVHAGDVEEKTFHLTAVAHYAQVLAFLEHFENSTAWADISHLKIEVAPTGRGAPAEVCRVGLTFNFYSSRQQEL